MDETIERLSQSLAEADSLEALVRPVLEMLEVLTGLESTYLTSIDFTREVQTVVYALNSGDLTVPEGLEAPWFDTLCKRCIESGRRVVNNVREIWGDSRAASALGIQTYASVPVCAGNGAIIGTLCGISRDSREVSSRARSALNVFAKLISEHLEREQLLEQLRLTNEHLQRQARLDEMSGLPNRKALAEELGARLASASRDGSYVVVCLLELDGIKEIRARMGYAAGEQFLRACVSRLAESAGTRAFLARVDWDEFALIAPGPADFDEAIRIARALADRTRDAVCGDYAFRDGTARYEGACAGSVAVRFLGVQQALEIAEEEMQRVRREKIGAVELHGLWRFA
ncbi:GGDEF domain-containing protein [Paraburkholderia acidisoli]|uniref:Diguanylate cyclase n=1 Tax=Paraburkholderia acidisoli TaxID=2571748 RepID=A0A7Z2GJZ6_9BURK|nr:diguanylate cyclase [Paraburkholderia acidisoli]QGZ63207.1 diguanylate cyclase [Paraburkholderia acidisoli]